MEKLERDITDKEEKSVALGTSKSNYMDPRITVQWCRLHDIDITLIFSKEPLERFVWAVDLVDRTADFIF